MRNSIETLKQNLNKIALDVHNDDDDEELEIHGDALSVSDRRNSHSFAHSKSVSPSLMANGMDSPYNSEIEQYKAEIRRLQESEAGIKALSVNHAALLKEKEDQISRLNQESDSLKKNLDATKEALDVSRSENSRASTNSIHVIKGSGDLSPNRHHKSTQTKNCYAGSQTQNGVFLKQGEVANGITPSDRADAIRSKMELKNSNFQWKEKELADLLEEKNKSLSTLQALHELQIKQLRLELEKEHDKLAQIHIKLYEEQKLKESFQEELRMLKMNESKISLEMSTIRTELHEKMSEVRQLQMELSRGEDEDANDSVKGLKRVIATLEKENADLKNELEAALEMSRKASHDKSLLDGKVGSSRSFHGTEDMELSLQKLEKDIKGTHRDKEKALHELTRLKQHLLEKESEESEKMDEDSKIVEELHENNEYQKAQILQLEKALKQAIAKQEEVRMISNNEIIKSKEIIDDQNKELANCMSIIDSKNVELLNLQTALGQYFAEIKAKENLEQNLASAREETTKLSELLKDAKLGIEVLKKEKEEILAQLSYTERTLAEGKNRVIKLEEDNGKLRHVVEQSMTRLNRMSMDSDYLVDRRIVIKLLVTYFQRNHSKEVLDLMVRMLGFSDEDKQRIGVAQLGGRGVVQGVLGLPGRLVGGILGGSSADTHPNAASDQSFADLWVDFLLKETEERERRESAEDAGRAKEDSQGRSPMSGVGSPLPLPNAASTMPATSRPNFSSTHSPLPIQGNLRPFEHSDSEFSTVPLTPSDHFSTLKIYETLKNV